MQSWPPILATLMSSFDQLDSLAPDVLARPHSDLAGYFLVSHAPASWKARRAIEPNYWPAWTISRPSTQPTNCHLIWIAKHE